MNQVKTKSTIERKSEEYIPREDKDNCRRTRSLTYVDQSRKFSLKRKIETKMQVTVEQGKKLKKGLTIEIPENNNSLERSMKVRKLKTYKNI